MFTLAQIVNLELIQKSNPGWFTPGNIISILVAIIAASAVIYNARNTTKTMRENNKDSIDANLKSKSRLQWIGEVRSKTSSFITVAYRYRNLSDWTLRKIEEINGPILNSEEGEKLHEDISQKYLKLDDYGAEAFTLLMQIKLYFSDNLEHKEIMNKVDEIMMCIKENKSSLMNEDLMGAKKSLELIPNYQLELIDLLREYLKNEWEKAKNGL